VPGPDGKLMANPYKLWSDIDPSLPAVKIEVLGPPPTSGTRDSFAELYMEAGCRTYAWLDGLRSQDEPRFKRACDSIREDGAYVEAGENDNLIVQKLGANKDAVGVFGYSFLEENLDKLKGAVVDGVSPTYDSVASGKYPASRPLFIYIKNAHANAIPAVRAYAAEFTKESTFGPNGYLRRTAGMIAAPTAVRARSQQAARALTPLNLASLK
jgi:phosphate transport system substrate-binding protein